MRIADADFIVHHECFIVHPHGVTREGRERDHVHAGPGDKYGIEDEVIGIVPSSLGTGIYRSSHPLVRLGVALRAAESDGDIDVIVGNAGYKVLIHLRLDMGDRRVLRVQFQIHLVHQAHSGLAVTDEGHHTAFHSLFVGDELERFVHDIVEQVEDVPLGNTVIRPVIQEPALRQIDRLAFSQVLREPQHSVIQKCLEGLVVHAHDREIMIPVIVVLEADLIPGGDGRLQKIRSLDHIVGRVHFGQEIVHDHFGIDRGLGLIAEFLLRRLALPAGRKDKTQRKQQCKYPFHLFFSSVPVPKPEEVSAAFRK